MRDGRIAERCKVGPESLGVDCRAQGMAKKLIVARPLDSPCSLGRQLAILAKDARSRGAQAPAIGPASQLLDGLRSCDHHRNDVMGSLRKRDVQECSQSTTSLDFRTGPMGIVRRNLAVGYLELGAVLAPNQSFLGDSGQVQKENAVEPFCSAELGRQL